MKPTRYKNVPAKKGETSVMMVTKSKRNKTVDLSKTLTIIYKRYAEASIFIAGQSVSYTPSSQAIERLFRIFCILLS
jgi:hypothetical protein